MRTCLLLLTAAVVVTITVLCHIRSKASLGFATTLSSSVPSKPDFEKEIKPILSNRCQPCHFPGGKVYDRMPFDEPETITRLGTKLFTRIKDEKERDLIRQFLAN